MRGFRRRIEPHVRSELAAAEQASADGASALAFAHLEQAHVLGQASTLLHVQVHWRMLRWALREQDLREVCGQLLRIVAAATLTALGWIPSGNTGGARVSPWRAMPLRPEHAELIARAKSG